MAKRIPDFLIAGGGVIGISVARALKRRHRTAHVLVLEKEPLLGQHASGRNSGVLHAGFYYSPDSLKARFTRIGNEALTQYCLERKLPIRQCGKLVVASSDEDLPRLDELHRRGVANGVTLQMISEDEARAIEPRAITHQRAIWSPATSTIDPLAVLQSLAKDAEAEGIEIRRGEIYRDQPAGFLINAAGLQADTIARRFGLAQHYRILPFKGLYLYSREPEGSLRTHIYPVPDPRFPFLGVHFTITVDGHTKIGPTAIPALWREQYRGLDNFDLRELLTILGRDARMVTTDSAYRRLAIAELRKYSRPHLVQLASKLARGVRVEDYVEWGRPGIRAQLYDTRKAALEMDFVFERDQRSLHILNAVSPGFTCALPFAEHVADLATK
ncbi:MAG TPA: L-2-hydroxyglutarate oxidase [Thermoanaerobaculia bacterium]|nr:L-2-hydroxyglutarate oxidase [Thermoanaerobaculia bacterium]